MRPSAEVKQGLAEGLPLRAEVMPLHTEVMPLHTEVMPLRGVVDVCSKTLIIRHLGKPKKSSIFNI